MTIAALGVSFCALPGLAWASEGSGLIEVMQHPMVEGMLAAVIVLSILAEIKTAGFSGGSLIAALAGCILLGADWYAEGGQVLAFLLCFGGMALIMMDILLFMTGVAAMAGMVAVLAGLFFTFGGNIQALYILMAAVLGASVAAYFLVGHLSRSRLWDKLTLKSRLTGQEGFHASAQSLTRFVGKEGTALSVLRPAGKVEIEGHILDAVSVGNFIDQGVSILVKKAENSYLVVVKNDKSE